MLTKERLKSLEPHKGLNDWVHVQFRAGVMREVVAEIRRLQAENTALLSHAQRAAKAVDEAAREILEATKRFPYTDGPDWQKFVAAIDALAAVLETK